jgi:hypothetical protein
MRPTLLIATLCAALQSCGGPSAPNCSDQPDPTDSALVTQAECSFVQQTDNILHHGDALAVRALTDQSGLAAGTITNQCGEWLMAKDPSGLTVVISTTTGEVRSHGLVHPGQPISSLPRKLALPLQY